MWCANCQDDVATEISQDGQALKCTACGDVVREIFAPSLHPETKSARELLQKWAAEQKLTLQGKVPLTDSSESNPETETAAPDNVEFSPSAKSPSEPSDNSETTQTNSAEKVSETESTSSRTKTVGPKASTSSQRSVDKESSATTPSFRVDPAHSETNSAHDIHSHSTPNRHKQTTTDSFPNDSAPSVSQKTPHQNEISEEWTTYDSTTEEEFDDDLAASDELSSPSLTTHHAQLMNQSALPTPPMDFKTARSKARRRPGKMEAIWGQLLAYAGVGILTFGSILVLWGYFGSVENYASTGWLLSTAGQMLLLLGLVTLISGGMEQTKHEVTEQIEYLGGRMIRIEESTEQLLKGPHFSSTRATVSRNSEVRLKSEE